MDLLWHELQVKNIWWRITFRFCWKRTLRLICIRAYFFLVGQRTYQHASIFCRPSEHTCLWTDDLNINCCSSGYWLISTPKWFIRPPECICFSSGGLNIIAVYRAKGLINNTIVSPVRLNVLACRPVIKHKLLLFCLRSYQQPNSFFRPSECNCLSAGG